MGRLVERRFLSLYDKRPFVGSVAGVSFLIILFATIGSAVAAIEELVGLPTLITVFLLSPVFLYFIKPVAMIVFLVAEFFWSALGIYYLLGIKGNPVRKSFK